MPITKRAIKKLAHDNKLETQHAKMYSELKRNIHEMRKKPSKKALNLVFQKLDKAAKKSLIHKNKAARLKSRLSKLLKAKKP